MVDASRGSVVRSHRRAMSCQISSTQVVAASRGSVLRSHRRAMSCQISSTQVVDASRRSVLRSHSKVMHGPCRPPQQVSAYALPPPPGGAGILHTSCRSLTAGADRPADRPPRSPARVRLTAGVAGKSPIRRFADSHPAWALWWACSASHCRIYRKWRCA